MGNQFSISKQASERVADFLGSQERLSQTHNINNYWLTRRMRLEFSLGEDGILVQGDTNLPSRVTGRHHRWMAITPGIPTWLLPIVGRVSYYAKQLGERIGKLEQLQRGRMELEAVEKLLRVGRNCIFPYGLWEGNLGQSHFK